MRKPWFLAFVLSLGIQGISIPAQSSVTGLEPSEQHCSKAVSKKLTLGERIGKSKRFLGYLIPIIPTIKTAKDVNKRFYVFFEQPLIDMANRPVSTWFAVSLKWFATQMRSYFTDGKFVDVSIFRDWFTKDTGLNMVETYFSFNVATIFRNGVTIDEDLSKTEKMFWNYWYSAATYGTITGATAYTNADSPEKMIFAHSTVAFAFLWPFLSQYLSINFLTPYVFNEFPQASDLSLFRDVKVDRSKHLAGLQQRITVARTENNKKREKALLSQKKWAEYFWKDLKQGEKIPQSRFAKYWVLKTKKTSVISIGMVSLYFMIRWATVGQTSATSEGHILPMVVGWMQDAFGRTPAQEIPKIRIDPLKMNKDLDFFAQMAKAHQTGAKIVELEPETVAYGYALQQDFISFLERLDATANSIDTEPVSP